MTSEIIAFSNWARDAAEGLKRAGVNRENTENFLRLTLKEIQKLKVASINAITYALNDALLDANIAIKEAPWLNTSGTRIVYAEVDIEGIGEIAAEV